jgi:hypothetical protein
MPIPPVQSLLPSVHGERPHGYRGAGGFARGLEQSLNAAEIAPGEHGHRWSRTGKTRSENFGVVNAQHCREMRYQRRARRLMPPIPQCFAKTIVFALL